MLSPLPPRGEAQGLRGIRNVETPLCGPHTRCIRAPLLTPRQRAILALVAAGATSKDIARRLGIALRTVDWHIARSIRRLGARSRSEAVAIAIRRGLLDDR